MPRQWFFAVIVLIILLSLGYVWSQSNFSANTANTTQIPDKEETDTMTIQIEQAATMTFADYNPMYVVELVNALQALGKEEALKQIEDYLQNKGAKQDNLGLFWVLRVLFDVPEEQGFPPVLIGTPTIPAPTNSRNFSRFPIVIVQDVPLLVVNGYALGGFPEPVEDHVAYFRKHGTIREQLLAPSDAVADVKSEFLEQWHTVYGEAHLSEVTKTIDAQLAISPQG